MLPLLFATALAAPGDDPEVELAERLLRAQEASVILGGSDHSADRLAWQIEDIDAEDEHWEGVQALLSRELEPQRIAMEGDTWWRPVVGVDGYARLAVGDGRTRGLSGDAEPGLFSPRVGVALSARAPWWEARVAPEIRVDLVGQGAVGFSNPSWWVGLNHGPLRAGFGAEPRWLGPARHSALILGDDAVPFPAGVISGEGKIPKLGVARAEVGTGWLQEPRDDVNNPGLLWMDARWAPVPYVEIGASRASIFGGEGRPMPSVGQLLLPLEPHVYDDPDKEEPDSDEIAALDLRVMIPLGRWLPIETLELWTQYGGDDMIVQRLGPLPLPSLAGIGNLFGAELGWGPLVASVEYSRLMDDYFRWYQGHRIYHDGFTQDGRSIAHLNGGDQETLWGRVRYIPGPWAAELSGEWVRRVGVLEVVQDNVFTLPTEEERLSVGAAGWYWFKTGGRLGVGYTLEHGTGYDFVPGNDGFSHRVWVELRATPWVILDDDGG